MADGTGTNTTPTTAQVTVQDGDRRGSVTFSTPDTGPNPPPVSPPVDPNRPQWLPENFNTPEDLAKSYQELNAKYTQTAQELAGLKNPNQNPATPEPKDDKVGEDPAKTVTDAAGFDVSSYSNEFYTTGDVTPENREKIAEGLKAILGSDARALVDQYIEGQKAVQKNDKALYYSEVGGEEAYTSMVGWAAKNWSAEEIDSYNAVLATGNRHATMFAMRDLKNKFESAQRSGRLSGSGMAQGGVSPFSSTAEMVSAMQDPRYKTSPEYRAQVQARLSMQK